MEEIDSVEKVIEDMLIKSQTEGSASIVTVNADTFFRMKKELDKYKKAYEVILNGLKYYSQRMGMGGTGRDAIKEASKILECEE